MADHLQPRTLSTFSGCNRGKHGGFTPLTAAQKSPRCALCGGNRPAVLLLSTDVTASSSRGVSTLLGFPAPFWEADILCQDTESNWQIGLLPLPLQGVGWLCSIVGARTSQAAALRVRKRRTLICVGSRVGLSDEAVGGAGTTDLQPHDLGLGFTRPREAEGGTDHIAGGNTPAGRKMRLARTSAACVQSSGLIAFEQGRKRAWN